MNLPFAELSYNSSYQSSIKMVPFRTLYGRKYRSPICWYDVRGNNEFEPDYIKDQQVIIDTIRDSLKIAQSRHKSNTDLKRRRGNHKSEIRVSPTKGVKRFGVKGKLSPWYIVPFRVLSQKGTIAFVLELPVRLFQVHNVFHISQL
jgi:hypothetical protein